MFSFFYALGILIYYNVITKGFRFLDSPWGLYLPYLYGIAFQRWKDISREYKKTEEYSERKRAVRHAKPRNPASNRISKPKVDLERSDDDFDSDEDPGVPMVRSVSNTGNTSTIRLETGNGRRQNHGGFDEDPGPMGYGIGSHLGFGTMGGYRNKLGFGEKSGHNRQAIEAKKRLDKEKLIEFFAFECGGRLVDVKVWYCKIFLDRAIKTFENFSMEDRHFFSAPLYRPADALRAEMCLSDFECVKFWNA